MTYLNTKKEDKHLALASARLSASTRLPTGKLLLAMPMQRRHYNSTSPILDNTVCQH